MNLSHLRYFAELAHTQHYTRAAERLYITQPSLSHAIGQLEEELGVALFERTGRNTVLTRCGEQFLQSVERSLAILDEGVDAMRRAARGEGLVRLGFLRILGVDMIPELAAGFLAANPGKDIRFTFETGGTQALLEGLTAGRLDLVFSSRPDPALGLTAQVVGRQDLVLIVPEGHPLSGRDAVDLRDTLEFPYVGFSPRSGLRQVVDSLFEAIGKRPRFSCEVEEDQVVAGLVARGFGIAVVPSMDILSHLRVKALPIEAPAWERNFYMISNSRLYSPPVIDHFRAFTCRALGIDPAPV